MFIILSQQRNDCIGIISFEEGWLHIIDNIYLLIYCLFWILIHEINEIYCIIDI